VSRYYSLESSLESSLEKTLLENLGRREEESEAVQRVEYLRHRGYRNQVVV
jgi:hypothetical protein